MYKHKKKATYTSSAIQSGNHRGSDQRKKPGKSINKLEEMQHTEMKCLEEINTERRKKEATWKFLS